MKQAALQADRKKPSPRSAIHHHPGFCPQQREVWLFPSLSHEDTLYRHTYIAAKSISFVNSRAL